MSDDVKQVDSKPETNDIETMTPEQVMDSAEMEVEVERGEVSGGSGLTLAQVESAIATRMMKINDAQEKLTNLREMVDSYLENNEEYLELAEAAKEASSKKNAKKKDLLLDPGIQSTAAKLKEERADMKDLKESLTGYLREFERLSGTNQIELPDGEMRKIVYKAKLVKRS